MALSLAQADDAKTPDPKPEVKGAKVPFRLVQILTDSHQALLFDRNKGTHVLADVGGSVAGYQVDEIADDEITLSLNGRQIVLVVAGPEPTSAAKAPVVTAPKPPPPAVKPAPKVAAPPAAMEEPADPYGDAQDDARVAAAPARPVRPPAGRVIDPDNPYEAVTMETSPDAVEAAAAAAAAELAAADDDEVSYDETVSAPPPAPRIVSRPPTVITPTVLSRNELNVALNDFNKLATMLRGSFTAAGVRLDTVADGSVFAKAGLRRGDVIAAVDGRPLKTIDDAADLYVRASATRAANIQIVRAGQPLMLRVLIQ